MSGFEILIGAALLVGLVGTVIPYFPGILLMLAAGLAWALLGQAGTVEWVAFGAMAVVGVVGLALSTALPLRTAAGAGAPRWVLAVGVLGVVVGFFVIPVVGALIGGPLAILIAEFYRLRDLDRAWGATVRALKGIGLGILVEFLAGVVMVALWISAVIAS